MACETTNQSPEGLVRTVAVNGAQVAYRVAGEGPPVGLVHGTGGNAESNWDTLLPYIRKDWTVIRPDYAGSGATIDPHERLTVHRLAEQVMRAMEDATSEPCHLIGFSLGAAVAIKAAAEWPERVASLTLIAGFASASDPRLREQFRLWRDVIALDRHSLARLILLTGFSPDFVRALGDEGVATAVDNTVATTDWAGLKRQVEVDLTLDVERDLAKIQQPTLVVGCTLDHMVPPSHSRELANRLANAEYRELPSGHLLPLEDPDALAAVLRPFLERQSRQSTGNEAPAFLQ